MVNTIAAIAIVVAITAGWVIVVQYLLPVRTKWRVVALALGLGALSPVPLLIALRFRAPLALPEDPGLSDGFVISLTMAGLPEEFVKTVAVLAAFLVLRHFTVFHREVDRATMFRLPLLCGLAFAAVENIAYSINPEMAAMVTTEVGNPLLIPLGRSLAASFLHASLGCLMGIFFMRLADSQRFNYVAALGGFVVAVIGHTAIDWGLIVPALTAIGMMGRGETLDPAALEQLAPHFLLAAVAIPSVILAAIASVIVMRRRLRATA